MVKAQVLDIDQEKERISLGIKQLSEGGAAASAGGATSAPRAASGGARKGEKVTCEVLKVEDGGLEVRIVGTDIAHAVPLTLIAGAGHWLIGSIDWVLLVSLLVGSLPGIAIGSHFASRVPDKVLRPLLAGTLALVGGRLAF